MQVCKNVRTEDFHHEIDSFYTMIAVPIRVDEESNTTARSYKFQFC